MEIATKPVFGIRRYEHPWTTSPFLELSPPTIPTQPQLLCSHRNSTTSLTRELLCSKAGWRRRGHRMLRWPSGSDHPCPRRSRGLLTPGLRWEASSIRSQSYAKLWSSWLVARGTTADEQVLCRPSWGVINYFLRKLDAKRLLLPQSVLDHLQILCCFPTSSLQATTTGKVSTRAFGKSRHRCSNQKDFHQ